MANGTNISSFVSACLFVASTNRQIPVFFPGGRLGFPLFLRVQLRKFGEVLMPGPKNVFSTLILLVSCKGRFAVSILPIVMGGSFGRGFVSQSGRPRNLSLFVFTFMFPFDLVQGHFSKALSLSADDPFFPIVYFDLCLFYLPSLVAMRVQLRPQVLKLST
jgi:hypothetical protein